ncbi:hypothetical protein GJAV_G00171570 [Gymnothorax javanicus]|nr:hypothetical protein GJAV_G00171570 [Gymnothorax javanicus]
MRKFILATVGLILLIFFMQETEASARVVVTADPQRSEVMRGETVRLTCEVKDSDPFTRWRFSWLKRSGGQEIALYASTGEDSSVYTLNRVVESDSAQYICEAKAGNQTITSSPYTLTVISLPPVALTLQTGWTDMFNTERAALLCQIQDLSPVWRYKWYRDGEALPVGTDKDTYEILSAAQSDSGTYSCRGEHKDRGLYTDRSSTVTLSVSTQPSAVLTVQPVWSTLYTSEKVTLTCEVQSSHTEWRYLWYKDGVSIRTVDSRYRKEFIIPSVNLTHGGRYHCKGELPGRGVFTKRSNDVTLSVKGTTPKPLMTLVPLRAEIFTGDTVMLSCAVSGDAAGWQYQWYRGTRTTALTSTDSPSTDGSIYRISSAAESHRGEYWCRAVRGTPHFYTPYSDPLRLNITVRPKSVLTQKTTKMDTFCGNIRNKLLSFFLNLV